MRAMMLEQPGTPLAERDVEPPEPGAGQLLLRVHACGVCRTDLHVHAGELPHPKLPLVLGHEIVGTVVRGGEGAARFAPGRPGRRSLARLDLRRAAGSAAPAARTSASGRASPATISTAATPSSPWPTSATASRFLRATTPSTRRRSSAPA